MIELEDKDVEVRPKGRQRMSSLAVLRKKRKELFRHRRHRKISQVQVLKKESMFLHTGLSQLS